MNKKYKDDEIEIRPAKREDMSAVAEMIQELADFEKMSDGPKLSVEELQRDGYDSTPPAFRCLVAQSMAGSDADPLLGFALYFPTYSTWSGRALMLEDLYVRQSERRRGLGQRLFDAVAKEATTSGCSRLDFHVLEWNDARGFYARKGAVDLTGAEQWRYYRLSGAALAAAAEGRTDTT